jgi:hypothetical protein
VRTEARFPHVGAGAGHYESFYIKAASPEGGKAAWIRHTVHQRPNQPRTAALWVTLFDAGSEGPVAVKETVGAERLAVPTGAYVQVGDALLQPGSARGRAGDGSREARWDLRFADGGETLRHLPYDFLYRARLPRTKLLSPHPAVRFSGTVELAGRRFELDGWPGMVGHNWGAEHAERWIWIQASDLNGREGDYLDVAAGRIKVGRFTTPWVANGRIVLEGEPHRLGGPGRIYGTELAETPTSCEFTFPGPGVNVRGSVSAHAKDMVGWVYADPEGPEHNALNCSIADMRFRVERPGRSHAHVEVERAAAYELGLRDDGHGIPLQPYPDG